MPYAKINPSGCEIRKGRIKLRLDFFLSPSDPHYEEHHIYAVDEDSKEFKSGYSGELNPDGSPKDYEDYKVWLDSLPHIWRDNPFHCHFIYPDKLATDNNIKADILRCANYFFDFHQYCWNGSLSFMEEWKKVPVKAGEVRCRVSPALEADKATYEARLADILSRAGDFAIAPSGGGANLNIGEKGTIDIGSAAIDRESNWGFSFTSVTQDNPANDTGTIDTIEVWANSDLSDLEVATFYMDGNVATTTDYESIGSVTSGSKQTFSSLDMDVNSGDYLGFKYSAGGLETDLSGEKYWYKTGDYIPCTSETFTVSTAIRKTWSIYGTGTTGGAPISLSCSDGFKVGETPSKTMTASLSITDGIASGDLQSKAASMERLLTDGFKLGDTNLSTLVFVLAILDGVKHGDTLAHSMEAALSLTDGVSFGDADTIIGILSILDGIAGGDTLGVLKTAQLLLTDGMSLGDTALAEISGILALYCTDGLKAGDTIVQRTAKVLTTITNVAAGWSLEYANGRKVVIDSTGKIHVFYVRYDGSYDLWVYHAYSSNGGVTWSEEQIVSGSSYKDCYNVAACVDSDDNLHVVYEGNDPTGDGIEYIKYDGSWSTPVRISTTSGNCYNPAIAVDSNDNLHVVWRVVDGSTYQIQYRKYDSGWGSIYNIESDTYTKAIPSIAIDSNDYIHVVWHGRHSGSPSLTQIRYRKYTDSWQSIENVTSDGSYNQTSPNIAITSDDHIHVVWVGTTSGSPTYAIIRYRENTGSWQTIQDIIDGAGHQLDANISVDRQDRLYVVGRGTNVELYWDRIAFTKNDGSWSEEDWITGQAAANEELDHCNPSLIFATHPLNSNIPASGCAFVYEVLDDVDGSPIKFYATLDFSLGIFLSIIDGISLGDTVLKDFQAVKTLLDGFKLGDTATAVGILFSLILTDGFKAGDTLALNLVYALSVLDGFKCGDTPEAHMIADLVLTDGAKLGDTPTASMLAELLLTDGFHFGDADSIYLLGEAIQLSLTDGIKIGDTPERSFTALKELIDGIKAGDTPEILASILLQDGFSFGEALQLVTVFKQSLADGFKFGDVPGLSMLALLTLLEGIKAGDLAAVGRVGELLTLLLSTKTHHDIKIYTETHHDVKIFTESHHNVTIWTGEQDMTVRRDWQRGETIPIWLEVRLASTGALYDPDSVVLWLYDKDGTVVLDGVAVTTNPSTGLYVYHWQSQSDSTLEWYRAKGKAEDGSGATLRVTIENGGFNLQA